MGVVVVRGCSSTNQNPTKSEPKCTGHLDGQKKNICALYLFAVRLIPGIINTYLRITPRQLVVLALSSSVICDAFPPPFPACAGVAHDTSLAMLPL